MSVGPILKNDVSSSSKCTHPNGTRLWRSAMGQFTALVNSSPEQPSSAAQRLTMSNRPLDVHSFLLIVVCLVALTGKRSCFHLNEWGMSGGGNDTQASAKMMEKQIAGKNE